MLEGYNNFKKVLLVGLTVLSLLIIVACGNLSVNSDDANADSSIIVFKNVNVIPMNKESILEDYSVVVEDGEIVDLGKAMEVKVSKNARIINAKGKYLTPGLADMHVHFWYEDDLTLYLANGVTTIRDMFGNSNNLNIKKQIEDGKILGPRFYAASPIMDGSPPIWPNSALAQTPEEARQFVIEFKEMGYDFIKVYERLAADVYDAIIETAKEEDIPVVGHVPQSVAIEKVIKSGQKSIEHLDGYIDSESLYDLTIENNVWNCPTIVMYDRRIYPKEILGGLEYIGPGTITSYEKSLAPYSPSINTLKRITRKLHEKDAKILLGTDANNPFVFPGFSIHDELYNLVDAGLTPYEAIKTGTYNAAEFLESLDQAGTVEVGKNADLILLSANPLEDIGNMKEIEGVMTRGKWLGKEQIDEMLKTIANKYER